jgi:hypothetical protein
MPSEHSLPVSLRLPQPEPHWQETQAAPALLDQVMALRRRWRLIFLVTLLVPGMAGTALL